MAVSKPLRQVGKAIRRAAVRTAVRRGVIKAAHRRTDRLRQRAGQKKLRRRGVSMMNAVTKTDDDQDPKMKERLQKEAEVDQVLDDLIDGPIGGPLGPKGPTNKANDGWTDASHLKGVGAEDKDQDWDTAHKGKGLVDEGVEGLEGSPIDPLASRKFLLKPLSAQGGEDEDIAMLKAVGEEHRVGLHLGRIEGLLVEATKKLADCLLAAEGEMGGGGVPDS